MTTRRCFGFLNICNSAGLRVETTPRNYKHEYLNPCISRLELSLEEFGEMIRRYHVFLKANVNIAEFKMADSL